MFISLDILKPSVLIGSLVMYCLLFILCFYAYYTRNGKCINSSLHYTVLVSLFGLFNSALQIAVPESNSRSTAYQTLFASLFFGLAVAPLAWMAGISFFSTLSKKYTPSQVLLGYLLTFVQFVMIIVFTISIAKDFYEVYVTNLLISVTCLNWGYFLLFFWLLFEYKSSVPKSVRATVIIFGVLSTVRLITETALLNSGGELEIEDLTYVMFFCTDFITCISLYMTTINWRNIQKTTNDQQPVV